MGLVFAEAKNIVEVGIIKHPFHKSQILNLSHAQQGRQREPSVPSVYPAARDISFPILRRILEALRVAWRNSTPRYASVLERTTKNINLYKYLILYHIKPTTSRVYSEILVPLRHDWSRTIKHFQIYIFSKYKIYLFISIYLLIYYRFIHYGSHGKY